MEFLIGVCVGMLLCWRISIPIYHHAVHRAFARGYIRHSVESLARWLTESPPSTPAGSRLLIDTTYQHLPRDVQSEIGLEMFDHAVWSAVQTRRASSS